MNFHNNRGIMKLTELKEKKLTELKEIAKKMEIEKSSTM